MNRTQRVFQNMRRTSVIFLFALAVASPWHAHASIPKLLTAFKVDTPPTIDGRSDDAAWRTAKAIRTFDKVSNIEIVLKAVYTDTEVFFLIEFPDDSQSREHKLAHWNSDLGAYRDGPEREDTFVLKWSMQTRFSEFDLAADASYRADIWYWKAHRTDPSGFADDKMHIYSAVSSPKARRLLGRSGKVFYLQRPGDFGDAAYELSDLTLRTEDVITKYRAKRPTESRADVRAKGLWKDGRWFIEFGRKLDTGHYDDVQFAPGQTYNFGVSRYEMAGRQPDPSVDQPSHGAGDIGESLQFNLR